MEYLQYFLNTGYEELCNEVLNLIINGIPSIPRCDDMSSGDALEF